MLQIARSYLNQEGSLHRDKEIQAQSYSWEEGHCEAHPRIFLRLILIPEHPEI